MMKKFTLFLSVLIAGWILNPALAQQNDFRMPLHLGMSVPMGKFAQTSPNPESGFARPGLFLGVDMEYRTPKPGWYFGFSFRNAFSFFPVKRNELESQLSAYYLTQHQLSDGFSANKKPYSSWFTGIAPAICWQNEKMAVELEIYGGWGLMWNPEYFPENTNQVPAEYRRFFINEKNRYSGFQKHPGLGINPDLSFQYQLNPKWRIFAGTSFLWYKEKSGIDLIEPTETGIERNQYRVNYPVAYWNFNFGFYFTGTYGPSKPSKNQTPEKSNE